MAGHRVIRGFVLGALAVATCAGCGSSAAPSSSTQPTPAASASSPSPSASSAGATGAPTRGAASKTCVNGWLQPARGTAFYQQAVAALEQSQGGTGYTIAAVRYFAGPVPNGGVGAIYYLDARDPRLSARVLLVSGAGPASAAVAKTGTSGWKAGDWTGFRGQQPPAVHPPLPGRWAGPEYNPVTSSPPLLASTVAGCLDGT